MKNLQSVKSKLLALKVACIAVLMGSVVSANAALPAWATSMFTDVDTGVDDVLTAIGPIIGVTLVGFLIIKLIKRGAAKI